MYLNAVEAAKTLDHTCMIPDSQRFSHSAKTLSNYTFLRTSMQGGYDLRLTPASIYEAEVGEPSPRMARSLVMIEEMLQARETITIRLMSEIHELLTDVGRATGAVTRVVRLAECPGSIVMEAAEDSAARDDTEEIERVSTFEPGEEYDLAGRNDTCGICQQKRKWLRKGDNCQCKFLLCAPPPSHRTGMIVDLTSEEEEEQKEMLDLVEWDTGSTNRQGRHNATPGPDYCSQKIIFTTNQCPCCKAQYSQAYARMVTRNTEVGQGLNAWFFGLRAPPTIPGRDFSEEELWTREQQYRLMTLSVSGLNAQEQLQNAASANGLKWAAEKLADIHRRLLEERQVSYQSATPARSRWRILSTDLRCGRCQRFMRPEATRMGDCCKHVYCATMPSGPSGACYWIIARDTNKCDECHCCLNRYQSIVNMSGWVEREIERVTTAERSDPNQLCRNPSIVSLARVLFGSRCLIRIRQLFMTSSWLHAVATAVINVRGRCGDYAYSELLEMIAETQRTRTTQLASASQYELTEAEADLVRANWLEDAGITEIGGLRYSRALTARLSANPRVLGSEQTAPAYSASDVPVIGGLTNRVRSDGRSSQSSGGSSQPPNTERGTAIGIQSIVSESNARPRRGEGPVENEMMVPSGDTNLDTVSTLSQTVSASVGPETGATSSQQVSAEAGPETLSLSLAAGASSTPAVSRSPPCRRFISPPMPQSIDRYQRERWAPDGIVGWDVTMLESNQYVAELVGRELNQHRLGHLGYRGLRTQPLTQHEVDFAHAAGAIIHHIFLITSMTVRTEIQRRKEADWTMSAI